MITSAISPSFAASPFASDMRSHLSESHQRGSRRLMGLVREYHSVVSLWSLVTAWRERAVRRRPKRRQAIELRAHVMLRIWHVRARNRRFQGELAIVRALGRMVRTRVKVVWEKWRLPALLRRQEERKAAMLEILHSRVRHNMALCHLRRTLLRRGLGGFWVAMKIAGRGERLAKPHHRVSLGSYAEEELPMGALLRVQQEGFQRWRKVAMLSVPRGEYLGLRRRAAVLSLLRTRTWTTIAFCQRVRTLLQRSFLAMKTYTRSEPDGGSTGGLETKGVHPHHQHATTTATLHTGRAARHGKGARDLHRNGEHMRTRKVQQRQRNVSASTLSQRGMGGASIAEIQRKCWRRWRYIVAADLWPEPLEGPPSHVLDALDRLAELVADARGANTTKQSMTRSWHTEDSASDSGSGSGSGDEGSESEQSVEETEEALPEGSSVYTQELPGSIALDGDSSTLVQSPEGTRKGAVSLPAPPLPPQGQHELDPQRRARAQTDPSEKWLQQSSEGASTVPEKQPAHFSLLERALQSFDRIEAQMPPAVSSAPAGGALRRVQPPAPPSMHQISARRSPEQERSPVSESSSRPKPTSGRANIRLAGEVGPPASMPKHRYAASVTSDEGSADALATSEAGAATPLLGSMDIQGSSSLASSPNALHRGGGAALVLSSAAGSSGSKEGAGEDNYHALRRQVRATPKARQPQIATGGAP